MRLATDKTVHLSLWGQAPLVNKLTFSIRASDSAWHPGLPRCPLRVPPHPQARATCSGGYDIGFRV